MGDSDYLLALELQKEFDKELAPRDFDAKPVEERHYQKRRRSEEDDLNTTQNLVHPQWETLDPTPDVHALFRAFDDKFFQGRLRCVVLEWSKRMYSCAGICYTRRSRLGLAVTIRISEPLLKLRPRKDLIETLLHEMIHAYCSVLGIREGNGGHGPNFKKIMNGINKVAGTNITVYHNFYDEVNTYKTHWWRCNGICQNRKPFFGYVKRTSNRAPGLNDIWWKQHLESCGGTFLKIKEPEKQRPAKVSTKEKGPKSGNDLRKHFPVMSRTPDLASPLKGSVKANAGGTLLVNSKTNKIITSTDMPTTSTPTKPKNNFGNLTNVVGFRDLGANNASVSKHSTRAPLTGVGYSLTNNESNTINLTGDNTTERKVDRNKMRELWANKFPNSSDKASNQNDSDKIEVIEIGNDIKRRRFSQGHEESKVITIGAEVDHWEEVDDDIMIKEDVKAVIAISSDEDEDTDPICSPIETKTEMKPKIAQTTDERHRQIKQEIIDSSDHDLTEDDIEIIDDQYDDNLVNTSAELADTSLIDDLFGEDTLLKEFKKENAVIASNSRYHSDPRNDIITCPVCQNKVTREQFSEHIDGCVGITIRVNPLPSSSKGKTVAPKKKKLNPDKIAETLKSAGYDPEEFENVLSSSYNSDDEDRSKRRDGLDTSTHACPICAQEIDVHKINEHLDVCLK